MAGNSGKREGTVRASKSARGRGKRKEDLLSDCRTCDRWDDVKARMRVAETIAKSVDSVQERISNGEFEPTVAEYLKLVQMEREWQERESQVEGPKEIKVTWVEPPTESKSEK